MTFHSIPESRFLSSVLKTWITLFTSDNSFAGVTFYVEQPDTDIGFKTPSVVLKRVSEENWTLTRVGGNFGDRNNTVSEEKKLFGYTFDAMYQFDIFASSITEMIKYQTLIMAKLRSPSGADVFADFRIAETVIPIKDFASFTDITGTATDLKIKFRFWKDTNGIEVPSFDKALHQYSIRVSFRIDYLNEYSVPKITEISPTTNVI